MKFSSAFFAFPVVACVAMFCGCIESKQEPVVASSSSSLIVESSSSEELSSSSVEDSVVQDSVAEPESSSSLVEEEPESSSSQKVEVPKPVEKKEPVAPKAPEPKLVDLCAEAPKGALCDKRDGRVYKTVRMGDQIWMAENLNFEASGSWCYAGKPEHCAKYGRLYKWNVALGLGEKFLTNSAKDSLKNVRKGICPDGWHVPSTAEMTALYSFVRIKLKDPKGEMIEGVGTSLKKKTDWDDGDEAPSGSDRFGFGALPGGYRNVSGTFNYLGQDCNFWIASESSEPDHAPYWNLYFDNEDFLGVYSNLKNSAYSVRCIKD